MKRFLVCLLTVEGVVSSSPQHHTRGAQQPLPQQQQQQQHQQQQQRRTAVDLIDATSSFQKSTESTYDHMVELYADGDTHKLTYHWNDIRGNAFEGRVIHVTNSQDTAPSWLGFGIYDTFLHTAPVTSSTPLMVGSDAIIGLVESRSVKLYRLGAQQVNMDKDENGNALGVQPATTQALLNNQMAQHVSDDGTITTDLTFEKLVSDGVDVKVRHAGENVFLWAMGPPNVSDFQTHGPEHRGAFKLDLDQVQQMAQAGQTGGTEEQDQQDKFENNDKNQETTDGDTDADTDSNAGGGGDDTSSSNNNNKESNTSPVVTGSCQSTNPAYEKMVALTPTLNFFWTLHPEDNKMNALLEYSGGEAWLGVGFSQNGKMIGSTAVIGIPGQQQQPEVQKYKLNDKSTDSVNPMVSEAQTLTDARISVDNNEQQEGGGITTSLQFTKLLNEGSQKDEVVLTTRGLNTLLFAVGTDNTLGYHAHRGTFRLDLGSCSAVMGNKKSGDAASSHMGAWATHGTFAVLAWAIASPFAMTVAWFRTLVPSSWIYVHVFSNVVSFTFSLIAVIIAFASMSYQTHPSHFSEPHHWVGLVLIVAMTFQVMNGFLRPPVVKRDPYGNAGGGQGGGGGGGGGVAGGANGGAGGADDSQAFFKIPRTPREIWFSSHRLTGIGMLGMGIYQIQSGLNLFARNFNVESMTVWYWVYVTLFGSGLISLKLWIRYEEYKARRGMETLSASPNGSDPQDTDALPVQFDAR